MTQEPCLVIKRDPAEWHYRCVDDDDTNGQFRKLILLNYVEQRGPSWNRFVFVDDLLLYFISTKTCFELSRAIWPTWLSIQVPFHLYNKVVQLRNENNQLDRAVIDRQRQQVKDKWYCKRELIMQVTLWSCIFPWSPFSAAVPVFDDRLGEYEMNSLMVHMRYVGGIFRSISNCCACCVPSVKDYHNHYGIGFFRRINGDCLCVARDSFEALQHHSEIQKRSCLRSIESNLRQLLQCVSTQRFLLAQHDRYRVWRIPALVSYADLGWDTITNIYTTVFQQYRDQNMAQLLEFVEVSVWDELKDICDNVLQNNYDYDDVTLMEEKRQELQRQHDARIEECRIDVQRAYSWFGLMMPSEWNGQAVVDGVTTTGNIIECCDSIHYITVLKLDSNTPSHAETNAPFPFPLTEVITETSAVRTIPAARIISAARTTTDVGTKRGINCSTTTTTKKPKGKRVCLGNLIVNVKS